MDWTRWDPPIAPHVEGEYSKPDEDTGAIQIRAKCGRCGVSWNGQCDNGGGVRTQISRFASIHLHRDPFAARKASG